MALTTSQRQQLKGFRVISCGSDRSSYTAPTTLPKPRNPLPWGLLLVGMTIASWAMLAVIVYGLMQAAEQIRGIFG